MVLGQEQKVVLGVRRATETVFTGGEGRTVRAMLLQRLGKPTPERQAQPGYSEQC